MKVLFAAYEATPIYKVGGLGDVAGSLPKALKRLGVDIRLVMPGYSFIQKVPFLPGSEVPVYYLSHPRYFQKEQTVVTDWQSHKQFAWFSRQILESLPTWDFWPDIIHLNDWHPALAAVILKNIFAKDKRYAKIATVLTIHNLAYQGISSLNILRLTGLDKHPCCVLRWDKENRDIDILMEGIIHADFVNTVSPTYAREILTKKFGEGLDKVLKGKEGKVVGILNGVDYEIWNPQEDKILPHRYGVSDWKGGKKRNKLVLQKKLGLSTGRRPLIGMIARLNCQKGLDFLLLEERGKSLLERIINLGAQVVILGKGEKAYTKKLNLLEKKLKKQGAFRFIDRFDEDLAHLIYAASDIFLMPSRFEPCGLVQIIAMRYGSLPLAHKTGGLADTIRDQVTGFLFSKCESCEFLKRVQVAVNLYFKDQKQWEEMVKRAMREDFSLEESAREYLRLYQRTLSLKKETK